MPAKLNLRKNIFCAIDVETTGLDYSRHDIAEIAMLPLDTNFDPLQDVLPFHMLLKPRFPENIESDALRVNGLSLEELTLNGFDYLRSADLFDRWFERLDLAPGRRLEPLAHNWPFDRGFIREWMGPLNFADKIDGHFRDSMSLAVAMNDAADLKAEPFPFKGLSLVNVSHVVGVKSIGRSHSAVEDAYIMSQTWKKLIRRIY